MDDGREEEFRSKDYDAFSYGFCTSIHKSQGATFERAHIYSSSSTLMINKEMAYVSMSRSRESSKLYFTEQAFGDEERERMYSLMSRSSQKTVGLDYIDEYQSALPWQQETVLGELERNGQVYDERQVEEAKVRDGLANDLAKGR